MHWQHKATIMRVFANLPFGDRLYRWSQKRFGRLRAAPMDRLPTQVEMMRWFIGQRVAVEGTRCFEVGTGHIPLVPIGFFLSGAGQTITVDLHRRIDWGLTRDCLAWMVSNHKEVERLYADVVRKDLFNERFAVLTEWQDQPGRFLREAGIEYVAPMDAAHTHLPPQSIDLHFSTMVLEHIQPEVIADIFAEAKTILKPTGTAIHFVDLSDHFQHQDESITQINFLKFSDSEWEQIAGNEFAYCNRLRASDYLRLFQGLGFVANKIEESTDQQSLRSLQNGFSIDPQFHAFENEELSVTGLRVMLHSGESLVKS